MQTWEMVLFLASKNSINQKIVIPASNQNSILKISDYMINQFNLDPGKVQFIPIDGNNKNFQKNRDSFVLNNAEILIPVSIRNKGIFESFLKESQTPVINKFQTDYIKKESSLKKYSLHENTWSKNSFIFRNDYLFHWTRSSNNCWPGEKLYDFYSSILNSEVFPRNAFNTLLNILDTKCIYGSSRHMPSKIKCVSFTGKSPVDFFNLMKWRTRYLEMSYEPYGIGISKSCTEKLGIKKVIYCKKFSECSFDERWFYQSDGKKGDWKQEEEYRYRGDFSFSDIPPEYMICICRYPQEAVFIEKQYNIKTIHLFNNHESIY